MVKIFTIIFIVTTLQTFGQAKNGQLILHNGLYETKCMVVRSEDEGEQDYLRFYPNGKVISVGTDCEGTAKEMIAWFHLNAEQVSIGDFTVNGRMIKFSTTGKAGTVRYKGRINKKGAIKLKWRSLINGSKGKSAYYFVNVNGLVD